MKRSIKQVCTDGWKLLAADIKREKWAVLAIAAYFLIMKRFMYSLCPMVTITGFPCPACGLSRAGFSLLKGHFLWAFEIHPFIYPIVLLVITFFVFRYILRKDTEILKKYLIALMVGLIVYYVYRMIRYFPGDSPMSYYRHNYIRAILELFRQ